MCQCVWCGQEGLKSDTRQLSPLDSTESARCVPIFQAEMDGPDSSCSRNEAVFYVLSNPPFDKFYLSYYNPESLNLTSHIFRALRVAFSSAQFMPSVYDGTDINPAFKNDMSVHCVWSMGKIPLPTDTEHSSVVSVCIQVSRR